MHTICKATAAALLLGLAATQAQAESCTRSREYILTGSSGELLQQPASYQMLFRACLDTLMLSNVRDAFILKDGGIAVVPKVDDVATTASTLAQFCQHYPRATLRFVTHGELPMIANLGRAVALSSGGSTPCGRIMGGSP
jgi:hypothetical protein